MTSTRGTSVTRDLPWPGVHNVRDLGGLPLAGGGVTPMGRAVRADGLDALTPAGWDALWSYGVRTVLDLRRVDECAADVVRPAGLTVHRVSWDDYPDADWHRDNVPPGLPGSMRAFLRDYPEAVADTARLFVTAGPGPVLFHCAGGRDRTGLFAIVLGALTGVEPGALFEDYVVSFTNLLPAFRERGAQEELDFLLSPEKAERRAAVYAQAREVIDGLDADGAEALLAAGGLTVEEISTLRDRLLA